MSQSRCSFFDDQAPKLAILTSETDRATDWLFPLGRTFATVFETHSTVERDDCGYRTTLDEGETDRNTVGHYQPLVSHRLTLAGGQKAEQVASLGKLKNVWANQTNGGSTRFGNSMLTHLKKTVPRSPYLNIRVAEELMDGHNDIFGKDTREFIELLIQMSTID
ncbi:MAG: hypothetical protein FJ190_05380 [Gammaproteobacteria bacterium]|nr:hypothetical protein [Gammaproteobacteria bacterium]